MKSHVTITEEILKNRVNKDILEIAIRHHETLDGTGHPKQLTGEFITKTQRITTITVIISALSEERSYKQPFSNEKILSILKEMDKNNKICSDILIEGIEDLNETAYQCLHLFQGVFYFLRVGLLPWFHQ